MAHFIPEDKITEIKQHADILDIISETVLLKRAGRNYVGLCPFHTEKTPSFTVSPDKQIFYCFGCGAGGNVFSFLIKSEGLAFPEAAKRLADRYGIELVPKPLSPVQKRRVSEREQYLEINRAAMEFFRHFLMKTDAGRTARDYLKNREVSPETGQRFCIGYAPQAWDRLTHFFSRKKTPLQLVAKAGLVVPRKSHGGYYDRFRNRIIFPIFDFSDQVIGFGGRVMDEALPKYLNSPESPVYTKSKSLYGLTLARKACRETDTVFIVEGYFDLIKLHQCGIENSVATLGTALTEDHIRILKGYARKAVLVFDSDDAGIRAAHRSVGMFIKAEVDARVMVLPSGYDPDAYLSEFGYDEFQKIADTAAGMMHFLTNTAVERHGLTVEGKIRILKDMEEPLSSIRDEVARALYTKELAERIGIDEAAVMERIKTTAARKHNSREGPSPSTKGGRPQVPPMGSAPVKGVRFERQIIAMMLQYPDIIPEVSRRNVLNRFDDPALRSIGRTILEHRNEPVFEIINSIDDKVQQSLAAGLAMSETLWSHGGCLKLISQFEASLSRRNNDLFQRIKSAEAQGDQALLVSLLKERQMQINQSH